MSSVIRQLKNWFTKQNIYPQTVEQAIYDSEGRRLDNKIANGLSNPNLLINADFRNPVNQRGGTSWSGTTSTFTIDRWAMLRGTVTQTDKGLVCSHDGISDGFLNLHQKIEITPTRIDEKVTVSAKIDGEVFVGTTSKILSSYSNGENDVLYNSAKFLISVSVISNYLQVNLVFKSTEGQTIEWAKVEYGEIATPFRPRLYAEELQLCKRYYQVIANDLSIEYYGAGYCNSTTSAIVILPHELKLRCIATISTTEANTFAIHSANSDKTLSSISVGVRADSTSLQVMAKTSNLVVGQGCLLGFKAGAKITLDAEL